MSEDYNQNLKDALLKENVAVEIEGHVDYEIKDSGVFVSGSGMTFDFGDGCMHYADKTKVDFVKGDSQIDLQGNVRLELYGLKATCQRLKYSEPTNAKPIVTVVALETCQSVPPT